MRIYCLSNINDEDKIIKISEDINTIRKSICSDFSIANDYPKLEIWDNGQKIETCEGNDVIKKIADEIKKIDEQ